MKRCGHLWKKVTNWENLVLAARKARRGKRDRGAVQHFEFNLEAELMRLQKELESGAYMPGRYRTHWISRPKPRLISAAPYRDRVLHHALMNVLEPILDRHFHPDSYACRRERGTHRAADRVQQLMRRRDYFLQCDIRKYFPSIDHEIMKDMFRRLIKDKRALGLMDLIVDCANEQPPGVRPFAGDDLFTPIERRRGLPIGNLTSQWFANWYLNGLDHYVTSGLGAGAYVRYCDDFIVFAKDRETLVYVRSAVKEYLSGIRLKLHVNKSFIRPVKAGLTFVGMRIWRDHRLLKKSSIKLFKKRVKCMKKAYASGLINYEDVRQRLVSWAGHCGQTDSEKLLRHLSQDWRFQRAALE